MGTVDWLTTLSVIALLAGLSLGAGYDLWRREVPDGLWQVLGVTGGLLGLGEVAGGGVLPVVAWSAAALFVLEHLLPWDRWISEDRAGYADYLELAGYAAVLAFFAVAATRYGLGPAAVPVGAVAVVVTVLFARALFESRILYGGADAKALMVAGLLVPLYPSTWVALPAVVGPVTGVLPFSVDLLMDAALLSVGIPLAVGLLNLARGEFSLRNGFTTYTIPVAELPRRFVWVRDPRYPVAREEEDAVETTEEDEALRRRMASELRARGIERVRVGPQIPFVVLLALGAVAALALGNLVLDLLVLV